MKVEVIEKTGMALQADDELIRPRTGGSRTIPETVAGALSPMLDNRMP